MSDTPDAEPVLVPTRAGDVRHPGLHGAGGRRTGWCGLCHRPAVAGATEGDWWHVWASDVIACHDLPDAWFIPDDEATGHTYRERAAHLSALEAAMSDTKRVADSKPQRRVIGSYCEVCGGTGLRSDTEDGER